MANNLISVDDSQIPVNVSFSKSFNVAVPMIDRHLDEGRGAKIAIQGDFGWFFVEVKAGKVVCLLQCRFQFHGNDGEDGICLRLVDAFCVG